jgi:hypothetical protein
MDISFGTWNVQRLCTSTSLGILSKELAKYKLGLVRGEAVRLENPGAEPAAIFQRKRA